MLTIIDASIRQGYTGADHLIDSADEAAVSALVGTEHRTYTQAVRAVYSAYWAGCDRRVSTAKIDVTCQTARGRYRGARAGYYEQRDRARAEARRLADDWSKSGHYSWSDAYRIALRDMGLD